MKCSSAVGNARMLTLASHALVEFEGSMLVGQMIEYLSKMNHLFCQVEVAIALMTAGKTLDFFVLIDVTCCMRLACRSCTVSQLQCSQLFILSRGLIVFHDPYHPLKGTESMKGFRGSSLEQTNSPSCCRAKDRPCARGGSSRSC